MKRVVLGALMLAGCANVTTIGDKKADNTYRQVTPVLVMRQGHQIPVPVFVKAYPDGGKLALCGYYLDNTPADWGSTLRLALADGGSALYLGGDRVTNLAFLKPNPGPALEDARVARCIRTERPWREGVDKAPLRVTWPAVRP